LNAKAEQKYWQNNIPAWIVQSEPFLSLRAGVQNTLQKMANRASKPNTKGDLLNIIGGQGLYKQVGVHRATFFRHLKALEDLGFVVTISSGFQFDGASAANVYAIPGAYGALDGERMERKMQIMAHQGGGVYVPQVESPHDPGLFGPEKCDGGASQNATGGRRKMRRGVVAKCGAITPIHHPNKSPLGEDSKSGGKGDPWDDFLKATLAWLDRIRWRSETHPARRALLIKREPERLRRAALAYRAKVAEITSNGGSVRDPAALFSRMWETS
jgi:hypothetical protein